LEVPKNFLKNPKNSLSTCFDCVDDYEGFIASSFPEFDKTIGQCEQSKVFTNAYIFPCMILCAALTNDDIACDGGLSSIDLNSQTLALRVTSILYTAFTFFVSHIWSILIVIPKPPEADTCLYDLVNADLRVVRAMTVLLAETLPSFHFEGNHFVTFQLIEDLGFYYGFHVFAQGQLVVASRICVRKEHLAEFDLVTGIARDTGDVQSLVFLDFELLSGYFNDC
jgi:hypothetical protein